MAKLSDVLRKAVKGSDETVYRIAKETEIANSQIYRFIDGDGLSTANIEELADYLGYELVKKKRN
jgi:hypothetical protein